MTGICADPTYFRCYSLAIIRAGESQRLCTIYKVSKLFACVSCCFTRTGKREQCEFRRDLGDISCENARDPRVFSRVFHVISRVYANLYARERGYQAS